MREYPAMTGAELIDSLFAEEDRAPRRRIEEVIRRGEETAAPLREILTSEEYWYEGVGSNHWILVHAIVALSAMRDEKALGDLIEMVPHAYFSNHEDAAEVLPAALARFGAAAAPSFIKFISEYRGAHRDNPDYSYCRYIFSAALTRIARENPGVREQITDFLCHLFTDPQEDDSVFLSFSATHVVALDEERGLKALREAYDRDMIDTGINGTYEEFIRLLNDPRVNVFDDLEADLFDFYRPEAIRERQRERAEDEEEPLYRSARVESVPTGDVIPHPNKIVRPEKVGRNDPCPCGSGRKYKKCCGTEVWRAEKE
jgi:hypothetical protein